MENIMENSSRKGPKRASSADKLKSPRRTKNGKVGMYVYLSQGLCDRVRHHPDSLANGGLSGLIEKLLTFALEAE
jgi:hypothetical protein